MNVTIEDFAPCKKRLKIEVPANRVQQTFERVATDFQKEARIPGFRPGHAPRAVVLKKYQKDIQSETQRALVPEAYEEAIKEKKLRVVTAPEIEDVKYQPGLSLSFSTLVELAPDFPLPVYKGLTLKKQEETITDEEVETTLNKVAEQRAEFKDAPERPLAMGDFAVIAYTGQMEGKPLVEIAPEVKHLAQNPQYWLWMKPETFLPTFADKIVGMNKGDVRSIEIDFAADFPQAALSGKKVTYEVTLNEIKIKEIPPLDDVMAQELAQMPLADLKARVRENLEQDKKAQADRAHRQEIVRKLTEAVDFPVPPSVLESETQGAVYDIVSENQARGVPSALLEEKKDEIYANAAKSAHDVVKFNFIAAQIAEEEKITVSNDALAGYLSFLAQREGITLDKLVDRVRKQNAFGSIQQQLLRQQVLDFILKEAKFE